MANTLGPDPIGRTGGLDTTHSGRGTLPNPGIGSNEAAQAPSKVSTPSMGMANDTAPDANIRMAAKAPGNALA